MLCSLLEVAPPGLALTAPLVAELGSELPRGSLVLADGACADGSVAVELLSVPLWSLAALDVPPLGARGCMAPDALRPPENQLLVQADAWPLRRGELVALGGFCESWTADGAALSRAAMGVLQPMSAEMLEDATQVRDAYEARFGPINLADLPVTGSGFVGLPLPRALSREELEAVFVKERLDTLVRRQKAVRWLGGEVEGRPSYAHFLGADPVWSDIWARPDTLVQLLDLAAGWARACPNAVAAPETCLLQLGDLAWFEDVLPDPLGHKDHHAGTCVDVRLFRDDGSRYEAWWSRPDDRPGVTGGYDRELTIAFLRWVVEAQPVTDLFIGDRVALRAVPQARWAPGHDDHIHLCL